MDVASTGQFTWLIGNFTELKAKEYSPEFTVGFCKWRLVVYPNGNNTDHLSVYLEVANPKSLASPWRRRAEFTLSVVNQFSSDLTLCYETEQWFDATESDWGYKSFIPLNELKNPTKGYLVNNRVIIEVDLEVFEVQGDLEIIEKPPLTAEKDLDEESSLASTGDSPSPMSDAEDEVEIYEDVESFEIIEADEAISDDDATTDGLLKSLPTETELIIQTADVNGFLVHDSQAEQVVAIFEHYPDFASNFRIRNQELRTAFMIILLDLIEALCRSPLEITEDDLIKGRNTLTDLEEVGLNLNWLKTRFEEVSKKKKRACDSRVEELGKKFEELKLMIFDLEAALEKEKEEVAAVTAPLSFNDFIS